MTIVVENLGTHIRRVLCPGRVMSHSAYHPYGDIFTQKSPNSRVRGWWSSPEKKGPGRDSGDILDPT